MGKKYSSPIEAKAQGSLCNFQLEFKFKLPLPSISIPLPDFDFKPPRLNMFCPLD